MSIAFQYFTMNKILISLIVLVSLSCKPVPQHLSNKKDVELNFDSLLNIIAGPGFAPGIMNALVRDTFDIGEQSCLSEFDILNDKFKITYRSNCFSDAENRTRLSVNNLSVNYLIDELNDTSYIRDFGDFELLNRKGVRGLEIKEGKEKLMMLSGSSFIAAGKYRCLLNGILLHIKEHTCTGYYLLGYKNIPGEFIWRYNADDNTVNYLQINEDIYDPDTTMIYQISPAMLDLTKRTFSVQKNADGAVKVMTVSSSNFYENDKVRLIRKNW